MGTAAGYGVQQNIGFIHTLYTNLTLILSFVFLFDDVKPQDRIIYAQAFGNQKSIVIPGLIYNLTDRLLSESEYRENHFLHAKPFVYLGITGIFAGTIFGAARDQIMPTNVAEALTTR